MFKPPKIMDLADSSRKNSREFFCTLQGIVTERSGIICTSSRDRAVNTMLGNSTPKKGGYVYHLYYALLASGP